MAADGGAGADGVSSFKMNRRRNKMFRKKGQGQKTIMVIEG